MKHKILYPFIWALVTVAIVFLGIVVYWLAKPYDNVTVQNSTNLRTQHVPGDILTVTTPFCTHGVARIHVIRKLISNHGASFLLPKEIYPQNPDETRCGDNTSFVQLPDDLAAGEWRFEYEFIYKANPIREIMVESITPPFTVTRADPVK